MLLILIKPMLSGWLAFFQNKLMLSVKTVNCRPFLLMKQTGTTSSFVSQSQISGVTENNISQLIKSYQNKRAQGLQAAAVVPLNMFYCDRCRYVAVSSAAVPGQRALHAAHQHLLLWQQSWTRPWGKHVLEAAASKQRLSTWPRARTTASAYLSTNFREHSSDIRLKASYSWRQEKSVYKIRNVLFLSIWL